MAGGASAIPALVGTAGTAIQGATPQTPAFGTGANRTKGNLLVCFAGVLGSGTAVAPTTPTGWTLASSILVSNSDAWSGIYTKIAAGGDAAPSIAAGSTPTVNAKLVEFTGVGAAIDATSGGAKGTSATTSFALNLAYANGAVANTLFLVAYAERLSSAAAVTNSVAIAGSTGQVTDSNAASAQNHYLFSWALGSSSTTSVTMTVSGGTAAGETMAVLPLLPLASYPSTRTNQAMQAALR